MVSNLALLLVVFKLHNGSEGVNMHNMIMQYVFLTIAF